MGAHEPAGRLVGQRLGPYDIGPLLGAGGMGEVYRARDPRLARDVAIKILPGAFSADSDRRARFEREARLLAALNHPHIGAIYGFEDREGIHALVLELVEGETLDAHLRAQARRGGARGVTRADGLPVAGALAIARQIADALEAAHERGIVHRDLKPANIILQGTRTSSSGEISASDEVMVKVVDFGLAKLEGAEMIDDSGRSPTMTIGGLTEGVILGTAAYMSPEQARGRLVDKRTDIWAFGCVLYEMLTGRNPFAGETVSDMIAGILEREPDWQRLPDATPPTIRRLLQRCLEKDLRRRLHDIADARLEIDDASCASGIVRASGPLALAARPASRMLWAVAGVLAIVAMVAAAAAAGWWPGRTVVVPPAVARVTISLPSGQVIEKGRFSPIALSPDGRLVAYTASVNGGRTNLYLRPLDDLVARAIPAPEGATTPFFSRDGRWLGFYANGALKKVSVAGGVPLTICDAPPVASASWGENDTIVFGTMLASSGLWRVSANGGEPAQITTPKADETSHGYPQLLTGGREAIFSVRRRNAWHLALLDVANGTWRLLGNGRVIGEGAQLLSTGHLVYAQSGGLVATRFTLSSGTLDEPPVPLFERLETPHFAGAYFAVAADAGTLVYVPASGVADGTLLRVERDGRAAPLVETRAAYEDPVLAPDGRRVAVTIRSESGSDVWILDLGRTTRVRATAGGTSGSPVWGSDGARVAYQSTAPGPWNLFWTALDGSEPQAFFKGAGSSGASWSPTGADLLPGTLPTLSGAGPQFPMAWSPDGRTLAFHERKPHGERDIWVVTAGSDPVPFLITPFDERSPRFSPDGKWLAYVSDESGRNDVYVQPFPGPGPKWLVSTDGGIDPVWSKDGRELFYRHADEMMAAAVSFRTGFSAGRPQRLFEVRADTGDNGPNYDVSPDGAWFVMPRRQRGDVPGELHLVLNWFGEVTARSQGVGR